MFKKKKILFAIKDMNLGGTEKSLLSLLSSLNNSRYEITLLLLEDYGDLKSSIPENVNVKILEGYKNYKNIINDPPLTTIKSYLKVNKFYKAINLGWIWMLGKATNNQSFFYELVLKNTVSIGNYDIAVAYAGPYDFISYLVLKKIVAKRKIQWIHFDVTKVLSDFRFGNRYYKYFDEIVCVSKSAKEVFNDCFKKYASKTIVIENSVSIEELYKLANDGETYTDGYNGTKILTLGRISSEKGQLMIPRIVEILIKQRVDFRWYCIGDGNEFETLSNEIVKKDLNKYIVLLGAKLNPYRFLKDCDIYVQTSLHEGYGLTMKEAKCFNKACVVTNVVSATDFFSNNENGLIVNIDPISISLGILKLLEDKSLRNNFQEKLIVENKSYINKIIEL